MYGRNRGRGRERKVRGGAPGPYGLVVGDRPYGTSGTGRRVTECHPADRVPSGQPLTAPDMIPPTICLPKITKTTSSGSVLISAPAMTMLWSGV